MLMLGYRTECKHRLYIGTQIAGIKVKNKPTVLIASPQLHGIT